MFEKPILFDVNVIVFEKQDCPFIKLERQTNNPEIIKNIVSAALNNRPITIQPNFRDKCKSLASLQEKGIIYRENDQYFFNM